MKTDGQGEVIGLFLQRGDPARDVASATRSPRSRRRAASSTSPTRSTACTRSPTRRRCTATSREIDVFEVYNARLLFETYNDEALRFARKYNLTMGAGSDAHVLQGVGTGALRMRAFDGPEEFLLSLRTAEILRRPKSLLYLQSLKWAAQAKERVR